MFDCALTKGVDAVDIEMWGPLEISEIRGLLESKQKEKEQIERRIHYRADLTAVLRAKVVSQSENIKRCKQDIESELGKERGPGSEPRNFQLLAKLYSELYAYTGELPYLISNLTYLHQLLQGGSALAEGARKSLELFGFNAASIEIIKQGRGEISFYVKMGQKCKVQAKGWEISILGQSPDLPAVPDPAIPIIPSEAIAASVKDYRENYMLLRGSEGVYSKLQNDVALLDQEIRDLRAHLEAMAPGGMRRTKASVSLLSWTEPRAVEEEVGLAPPYSVGDDEYSSSDYD